jgi:xanthosine utilization system XapX-like protein
MSKPLTKQYDELPKIVRILLQIFLGYIVGGIYRVIRFTETKNIVTLIVGLVGLLTGFGNFIVWLIDLITTITNDKITFLAD